MKNISRKIKNNICNVKGIPVIAAFSTLNEEETLEKEVFTSDDLPRTRQILQDCDLAL